MRFNKGRCIGFREDENGALETEAPKLQDSVLMKGREIWQEESAKDLYERKAEQLRFSVSKVGGGSLRKEREIRQKGRCLDYTGLENRIIGLDGFWDTI